MNQLSKENLNLVRLINRLERNPSLQIKKPRMDDSHELNEAKEDQAGHEEFDQHRYWELKGLETTIRHARSILDTINSNPNTFKTVSQIQDPIELRSKLERIQDRIDVALKTCPAPTVTKLTPSRPSTVIYEIKAPELPSMPNKRSRSLDEQENQSKEIEKEEVKKESESDREETRAETTFRPSLGSHPASNLNSNQEELTDELSQMASQLKKNVHHFNKLLADDQAILLANQTKLELNSDSMNKEGGRLTQVSLKSRSMTWFTIAAVCVVAISWILMFIIIRLT
ncbi:hypothetical protein PtA15_9A342 [Puccinia triticina]|uniref:Vesicle transport protein USE1 n=1 Tax=Puccinia triticina TaxID=208348 RepID=A0ABY7CU78_9BASI|nr:uncharacterized protein PtA15_9A342 [Puccinia triticina]WAQ88215.1 hypothetical protein PtA15_9A342 [Puccinia triticina]